jgi:hypothetical protein
MTTHIMLDIETLGTRPGAVILSAALVRFRDEAHTSLVFDQNEQFALGMEQDASTLAWWQQQGPEAQAAATANPIPIAPALQHISDWLAWAAQGGDFLLWCHGATFDCPLLEELYRRANTLCPWKFWQVRDTRTLYDLAAIDVKAYAVPPPHVALNDALAQTRAANAALAVLARAHAGNTPSEMRL